MDTLSIQSEFLRTVLTLSDSLSHCCHKYRIILRDVLCCAVLSHVQLFENLWTVACQAPLSMFSGQEYWSGFPFPPLGSSQCSG